MSEQINYKASAARIMKWHFSFGDDIFDWCVYPALYCDTKEERDHTIVRNVIKKYAPEIYKPYIVYFIDG